MPTSTAAPLREPHTHWRRRRRSSGPPGGGGGSGSFGGGGGAVEEWSDDGDGDDDADGDGLGGGGAVAAAPPPPADGAAPLLPTRKGKYDFASRDVQRYARFTEREILAELARPLELHTREITQHQLDFLAGFPFEKLKATTSRGVGPSVDQTDEATARLAREEIAAPRTARFIGILALFLYRFHMAERCKQPADDAKLGALMTACQQYFAALRKRMLPRKRLVLVVLPALLLSVRMSVEALFRGLPQVVDDRRRPRHARPDGRDD